MQCSCNEETNLVISGQMTRFIECNDGAFSERISLNVFRWTGREVIKFGPNNGIYLGDKMEGRVGWKIIGSSLGPMYTRRMKRRSKFKVTYMYKRITGIGSKREETGARWNGWGELGKNFRDAWRETCVTDGEIFGSRRWDYSDYFEYVEKDNTDRDHRDGKKTRYLSRNTTRNIIESGK